ncbi:MAG TPA: response regulator [Actinomycetota bacterium]|nr:response regulator [Actinomycetota bacterium]
MPRTDRPIVLIVTTDARVLQAAHSLPQDRFEVGYARSSQEALAVARQDPPEVAVLELRSGDFGGFALAKELRDIPGMPPFKLVMTCDRPHDRWLCRQAGAESVLVKPLSDPSALLEALDSVLQLTG